MKRRSYHRKQAHGEDAALRELMAILQYKEDAKEVLSRIRAGKVPGVWWYDETGKVPVMREKNTEIADLRAELAALKGRKVKLPESKKHNCFNHMASADAHGYNSALEDCADAIRAAGVEVADA